MSLATPVAFWELDNENDSTANAYHLTNNGTVTFGTGKVGNAATTGGSKYLSRVSNADLRSGGSSQSMTFAFWAYALDLSANGCIFAKGDGSSLEYMAQYTPGGGLTFTAASAGGFSGLGSAVYGTFATGAWHCVVCKHIAGDNLYISFDNGSFIGASPAFTGGIFDAAGAFALGNYIAFSQVWNGLIDQFGVWREALSTGDTDTFWNGGVGIDYATMTGGSPSGGGKNPFTGRAINSLILDSRVMQFKKNQRRRNNEIARLAEQQRLLRRVA